MKTVLGIRITHTHTHAQIVYPDNKVRVVKMGPTWVLAAPGGPHFGPMNLAIRIHRHKLTYRIHSKSQYQYRHKWLHPYTIKETQPSPVQSQQ